MTRFDAPPSSPSQTAALGKSVIATLRGNPGLVLSTLLITSVFMLSASVAIMLAVAVPNALRGAFAATPILVFVAPGAPRIEVEALGTRLKAVPTVADASLRSKEVAMVALVEAGLPPATDGRNPLSDVWTIHLHLDAAKNGDPNFMTVAVGARDVMAALPGVERVKFDDGWVALLDHWARQWSAFGNPAIGAGLLIIALCLFSLYGLFTRALRRPSEASIGPPKSVLAISEALISVGSAIIVYLCLSLIAHSTIVMANPLLQPIGDLAGPTSWITVASLALTATLIGWIASAIASHK